MDSITLKFETLKIYFKRTLHLYQLVSLTTRLRHILPVFVHEYVFIKLKIMNFHLKFHNPELEFGDIRRHCSDCSDYLRLKNSVIQYLIFLNLLSSII